MLRKVDPVPEHHTALVHAVRTAGLSVAEAARRYGVSRKTAFKWLARFDADPTAPLADRSRRPVASPARTPAAGEAAVLEARDRWGWGPRKLHAVLKAEGRSAPPVRTIAAILRRHGRIAATAPAAPAPPPQRFERGTPTSCGSSTSRAPWRSNAAASARWRSSTTTAATCWPCGRAPTRPTPPSRPCSGTSSATSASRRRCSATTPPRRRTAASASRRSTPG